MDKMKKLTFIWGALILILFITLTTFGLLWKNKNMVYKDTEKELESLVKSYKDAATIPGGGIVSVDELIDMQIIESLKANDEVCDGYVNIANKNGIYKYTAYIKCENYTTKGY